MPSVAIAPYSGRAEVAARPPAESGRSDGTSPEFSLRPRRRTGGADVDVSISITAYSGGAGAAPAELVDLGRAADDCGLHTIWATDHLIQADPAASATDPMLEAYSVLSFLAAATRRVRLGA